MAERRRTRISSKITQLPEEVKEQLDELLLDTSNTYEEIAKWLKSEGYEISKSAGAMLSGRIRRRSGS
mgnify:CR=1 FL=1